VRDLTIVLTIWQYGPLDLYLTMAIDYGHRVSASEYWEAVRQQSCRVDDTQVLDLTLEPPKISRRSRSQVTPLAAKLIWCCIHQMCIITGQDQPTL
jgi:hypothetical protein